MTNMLVQAMANVVWASNGVQQGLAGITVGDRIGHLENTAENKEVLLRLTVACARLASSTKYPKTLSRI